MISVKSLASAGLGLILGSTLFLVPANAQQASSPQAKPQPAAAALPGLDAPPAEEVSTTPTPNPPNPYQGTITSIGTGLPFLGTTSPLRWWDFSVERFEYIGVRDEFAPQQGGPVARTNFSILRTALIFDHYFRQTDSRIVLQYLPQA